MRLAQPCVRPRLRARTLTAQLVFTSADLRLRESLAPGILKYAPLLSHEDHALLESVFAHHTPVALIAQAAGSHDRDARRLRHRVRRLAAHVLSPMFRAVARAIVNERLCDTRARVARCRFLQARTLRQTAAELHLQLHDVRRIAAEVEAIVGFADARPLALAA